MNPSRLFILRPVATTLLMVGLLLVGVAAYTQLPVSALPEVDYPTIQVVTFYPGADPDVMASSVTAPLERQFGQVPGLSQMTSTSSLGSSIITLQFNLNENIAIEGEGNFFPNNNTFGSLGEGRATQGQFGVKAGRRYKTFGVFAKARPGFLTVGDVYSYRPGSSISIYGFPTYNTRIGRETHFTTDVGRVLEFYPSRRAIVRFDAGDTIVRCWRRAGNVCFTSSDNGSDAPTISA